MLTYTVYVDQVFVGSLVMNYIILWLAARLGGVSPKRWRLLSGAALGAFYSLALFIPACHNFLTPGYKLLASLMMVAAVFLPRQPIKAAILLGYFYLATFALGGAVQGVIGFMQSRYDAAVLTGVMEAIDAYLWYGILITAALFWTLGRIAPGQMRKRMLLPLFRLDVLIGFGGRAVRLPALLDSGNSLSDPLTGNPVVIAEYEALQELFSPLVRDAVAQYGPDQGAAVLGALGEEIAAGHFRLIPYRSVGRNSGWLLGFRPDEVEVSHGGRTRRTGQVIVAFCGAKLDGETSCRALIPPALLDVRQ
ncbi:MAG: sigma-E processing peptidase SpoIIGA [Firmicutes bacterium]|nr:sigma-E processing peptidase SpoIIGA [Bacillota bacterium]